MSKTSSNGQKAANAGPGLVDAPRLLVELFPNPKVRPSVRTIRRMTANRKIPFVRFGGGIYFVVEEVRAILFKQATAKLG